MPTSADRQAPAPEPGAELTRLRRIEEAARLVTERPGIWDRGGSDWWAALEALSDAVDGQAATELVDPRYLYEAAIAMDRCRFNGRQPGECDEFERHLRQVLDRHAVA
jgi:hypothetical protein